jgi:hypothetical protein
MRVRKGKLAAATASGVLVDAADIDFSGLMPMCTGRHRQTNMQILYLLIGFLMSPEAGLLQDN